MNDKSIELMDSYVWEIDSKGDFNLVKRNERDHDKLHYDFLDLPDELMSQVQVNEFDRIF